MIAYRELIELETCLIRLESIRKTMDAVSAGIATIPAEGDKSDIIYFLSESLAKEIEEAQSYFYNIFETVRDHSRKVDSIDNT